MDRSQFESLGRMAKTFQGVDSARSDFWAGFLRGLRRLFHGENFGTEEEHCKWLALATGHESRRQRGIGYRAGFHHDALGTIATGEDLRRIRDLLTWSTSDVAEIAVVSPRTVEGWEQGRPIPEPALRLIRQFLMI